MLGVAAVIVVRSVMTGFGDEWEKRILEFKPHVTVFSRAPGGILHGEKDLAAKISALPGVVCATPEIDTRVLLAHKGKVLAPILMGLASEDFRSAYKIGRPWSGTFDLDGDSIVLGRNAAEMLGAGVGDEVVVYSPKTLASEDEVYLPVKWKVSGTFSTGRYDYDSGFAVAGLHSVRDIMGMESGVHAIHVKTARPSYPPEFDGICGKIREIAKESCPGATGTTSWREADRELFSAIAVEKNMTAVLMMLISVVALFCVMNTLLVLTVQKTPEIGLLKALGFSKMQIIGVFMKHGMIQSAAGVVLGLAASWAVLSNLQNIVDFLAGAGLEVFPRSVYGLYEIPHRLMVSDVVWTLVSVFFFAALASLVPALLAASKDPVKALNE